MEEVEKVMDDEYFGESYDKEMALQEEYYEIAILESEDKAIERINKLVKK